MGRVSKERAYGLNDVSELNQMALTRPVLEGKPFFSPLSSCGDGIYLLQKRAHVVVREAQLLLKLTHNVNKW